MDYKKLWCDFMEYFETKNEAGLRLDAFTVEKIVNKMKNMELEMARGEDE